VHVDCPKSLFMDDNFVTAIRCAMTQNPFSGMTSFLPENPVYGFRLSSHDDLRELATMP